MATPPKSTNNKESRSSKKIPSSTTGDKLHHLAFDNAAQANIISTVSNGEIITANSAASKLLGYSKKELLTKKRSAIFDITESSFKKLLEQGKAKGGTKAIVTARQKSGRELTCEITSAVFMDKDGIEKSITTIADMSQSILDQKEIDRKKEKIVAENIVIVKAEQKSIDTKKEKVVADNIIIALAKSDAILAESNKWIKYIAKTSYDVMWDWNIATGDIYVGDSIKEVFGYRVKDNTVKLADISMCLVPEEKDAVEEKLHETLASGSESWNDTFRFQRFDGTVASVTGRASIVRDEKGKAVRLIGAIHDISRVQELEDKLQEQVIIQEEHNEKYLAKEAVVELKVDRKRILVEKIKNVIIESVHHSEEQLQINYSDHLSKELEYDYTYLANLFSETEGIPIQNFIISQKIERAKDLILQTELNLTDIARKLHYSSVGHLSNQFKKVTGLTPSSFKVSQQEQASVLQNV